MRRLTWLLMLAAIPLASLTAQQRLGAAQKRPPLAADVDSNDARAYLSLGTRMIESDPEIAAAAFYWAARLDPSSPEALYGLRIAHLLRRRQVLKLWYEGGRKARSNKELMALDSLTMRASRLDPFLYRRWDASLIMAYYRDLFLRDNPQASKAEINFGIQVGMDRWGPVTRGWLAYSQGRLPEALRNYQDALKVAKRPAGIHLDMGRTHYIGGQVGPALDAFKMGIEALRKEDADPDEDVILYSSKAIVEHGIGILYQKMSQPDSAKAAFGRSMTEDLSYFMAHVALGQMGLALRDSVTAVSELGLAAEVAIDEPWVHFLYGSTLVAVGQHTEAVVPLKKAVELEPLYAAPQYALGQALEKTGDAAGAKAAFAKYLTIAPRREDANRIIATQRLTALGGAP